MWFSRGGCERVQAGVRVLTGGTRLGRPGSCHAPTVRADPAVGMPLLGEEVSSSIVAAWHPHLPSAGVQRSGYGRELVAHGACELIGGRPVWSGTSGAGRRRAKRPARCDFC
jgi:hypothetical protein